MDDWIWGYLLGRKKERQRHAQALAGQRYQMEQEIRAQHGLPLLPGPPVVHPTWMTTSRPTMAITGRLVRRVIVWTIVLVVVLVLLFLAFCIVYGVQHHLIYPMPRRSSGR